MVDWKILTGHLKIKDCDISSINMPSDCTRLGRVQCKQQIMMNPPKMFDDDELQSEHPIQSYYQYGTRIRHLSSCNLDAISLTEI